MVIREIEETMDGLAYQVHQALQVREAIQVYVALQVGEAIQVYLALQMRDAVQVYLALQLRDAIQLDIVYVKHHHHWSDHSINFNSQIKNSLLSTCMYSCVYWWTNVCR